MWLFKFDLKTETPNGKLIPKTDVVIYFYFTFLFFFILILFILHSRPIRTAVYNISIRAQYTWLLNDWLRGVNNRKLGNPTTPTRGPVSMPIRNKFIDTLQITVIQYYNVQSITGFFLLWKNPLKGPTFLVRWFIVVKTPRVHNIR